MGKPSSFVEWGKLGYNIAMSYFATPRPPLTAGSGRITVDESGTPVALSNTSIPCRKVIISAFEQNKDVVTVGDISIIAGEMFDDANTRTGITLFAGQSLELEIDNINKLFIDAVIAGEGITYIYLA
jgi:hypothetical protein